MENYCHDYKDYQMSGVPPTSTFIPVKQNGTCASECEIVDKERQLHTQYFKPGQAGDAASPVYPCCPSTGALTNSNIPKYGTVIPNRIFVGGIDFKTKEEDLQKFFCSFGVVRDTKIIRDRAEVSKGYGFVTFENADEANKVREQEHSLYMNGKKLNIGPAIRKQQICFPKDIHVPGPPGSWVLHQGGYASYTNQNGITYFAPAAPMMASLQQPQQTFSHMMTYNGPAYQAVPSHYPGYSYQPCASQTYNTVHLPWNHSPIAGACGQLIAPSPTHSSMEPLNVVPMAPATPTALAPATSYLLPRSAVANSVAQPVTRASEGVAVHQEKTFLPQPEQIRMIMPPNVSAAYVHPAPPLLHAPTAVYAQPPPLKCTHAQYIGLPEPQQQPQPQGHYPGGQMVLSDLESPTAHPQSIVTSENDILTPPLTPEQHQLQQQQQQQ